jgi:hypothetical protein
MTSDDRELKTPAEYFQNGRKWLDLAEWETLEEKTFDRSSTLAMLAMASALLGLCAQFIREQETD